MKKAFDQTVRDLKRGVNKKVLKVPSIEQKVLDATSNETWGPHGSLLADIAMASRNYHEYQMIMSIVWKRVNDTGKNWRHVYKGLTVLEYLVANGSERVIDEIREHSYHIKSLSDFQYLDHNGKDQGNNVRKKSQNLLTLVNDKEKIQEVRQKAAANWDKFHNTSGSAKYRPGSYPGAGGYDDDRYEGRYGSRDEDRNGNGYGYGGEKDGYGYGEERYGRDQYRDDDYRGRRSVDGDSYNRRSRSSDRDRDQAYGDDGQYSSRQFEQKSPEQNPGVPPSYEDAVAGGRSPNYNDRNGETKSVSPPPVTTSHETTVSSGPPAAPVVAPPPVAAVPPAVAPPPVTAAPPLPVSASENGTNGFDEFDPRGSFGSFPAAPPTSGSTETDLFGSTSDPFSLNSLALVPVTIPSSEPDAPAQTFVAASSASSGPTQPFDDPFGDGPFRAASSTGGFSAPPQSTPTVIQSVEPPQSAAPPTGPVNSIGSGGFDPTADFLADLLPPSGPSQTGFQAPPAQLSSQHGFPSQTSFPGQPNPTPFQPGFPGLPTPYQDSQPVPQQGFPPQGGQFMPQPGFPPHGGQTMGHGGFPSQMGSGYPGSNGQPVAQVTTTSSFYQQPQVQSAPALNASTGALVIVPQEPAKFETKSTVWADTLNRGLVNLNIAGSKTNPLSDIGVDFEALNRKDKRMEKPSATAVTSNTTMGKAMGSGSGIGRAGVGALRPQPNPMMGPSMAGPGAALGYGAGYAGMNQPMGQFQMQPPSTGYMPPGTYNPMMGRGGGYGQQPYGGGYR
ncbi:hypothetical protein L1987_83941 [Smallanthus sonchifolius]|uniref:Uncharacterized protein n=1 Tax=Smallanthus sonchifolius TaxID=185202 RepID=A0ACB8YDJ7_9ASTR|nr:hypothetical protein L1987_83941 [Smallanthus sonchifolius]